MVPKTIFAFETEGTTYDKLDFAFETDKLIIAIWVSAIASSSQLFFIPKNFLRSFMGAP